MTQINTRPFFLCFFFLLLFFYQAIFIISDLVPFQQDGGFGYYGQMILSNYRSRGFNQMLNRKCNIEGHPVVPIGENNMQRDCKYCQRYKVKTKRGWNVKTKFKCETCNVNLCSGDMTSRNCFVMFHDEFVFGKPSQICIDPAETDKWRILLNAENTDLISLKKTLEIILFLFSYYYHRVSFRIVYLSFLFIQFMISLSKYAL